jgi:hypothetical protein
MTKTFKQVIDGIRTAVLGKEVREDIAQMGEYVEQFAISSASSASAAAKSASAAKTSETNASSSATAAKSSKTAAASSATAAKNALDEIGPQKDAAIAAVGTAKLEALDNISSKVEQVRSDTAKAEQAASDAQSAADKAQAIATANNIDDVMMLMLVTGRVSFGLYTSSGDVLCTSDGDELIATGQICKC